MPVMDGKYWGEIKNGALFAAVLLLSSCTKIGDYAEDRADRAAYGNIAGAQSKAMGAAEPFSIGGADDALVQRLMATERKLETAEVLSLADTLAIAMANSRSYQTRKETLYIEALNLSETQKDFNWNYSASADVSTEYTTLEDGTAETFGDNGIDTTIKAGVTRTLATGAKVSLGFTQNVFSYFTNPDSSDANNALSLNIVQPLLNGFGPLVTKEPLRQAERDMVYAVREFKRYQQDFVIDIASLYYSTLQARDQLINQRNSFESAVLNRKQTESYAKAGRIADFQAAEAMQSELNAADRWSLAQSNYDSAIDDFRYALGLPIELNVVPDTNELARLEMKGLIEVEVDFEEALVSALSNRLDLINLREQVQDKQRKVEIRRRNFLPNLDVSYSVTKNLDTRDNSTVHDDVAQNLGVGLELPLDWTEKRNAYRIAQISLDREVRALSEEEDDIRRTVRDLWRKLERNRSVYKNRLLSVELSTRRVENTQLLLKQGKALTRDLLEAEDDLLSSKNEATAALVDYTINRLRFWNAIERFEIDPKGMWYEQSDPEKAVAAPQR
ncbi:TolC family protein [Pontiella sp.]|uniref:TolC family protein n=1 Tax=Pontiella sp. TaxID=2837462 RepID=UPI0035644583